MDFAISKLFSSTNFATGSTMKDSLGLSCFDGSPLTIGSLLAGIVVPSAIITRQQLVPIGDKCSEIVPLSCIDKDKSFMEILHLCLDIKSNPKMSSFFISVTQTSWCTMTPFISSGTFQLPRNLDLSPVAVTKEELTTSNCSVHLFGKQFRRYHLRIEIVAPESTSIVTGRPQIFAVKKIPSSVDQTDLATIILGLSNDSNVVSRPLDATPSGFPLV